MAIASITAGGEFSLPVRLQSGIRRHQPTSSRETPPAYSVSIDSSGRPKNPFLATLVEKESLRLIESKKQVPDPAIFDKNDDGKADITDALYDSVLFQNGTEAEEPHSFVSPQEALNAYAKTDDLASHAESEVSEAPQSAGNQHLYIA